MAQKSGMREEALALQEAVKLMMKTLPMEKARYVYEEVGRVFEESIERELWRDARDIGLRVLVLGFIRPQKKRKKERV
ncbi:MAG: hypothetical protein D6812_16920 [Deltaproteobacteria bacterium]|nr:MAG: hypothetical protein D6812_16920 [Deltaproteobacteria bacterium]